MRIYNFKLLLLIVVLVLRSGDTLAQVSWTKYEGNPIITGGPSGSWNHHILTSSILFNPDSLRYEMWFTASPYDVEPLRIGFAWSIDGIEWTLYADSVLSPTPGSWDQNTVEFPCVIREDGQYKMWYAGASQYLVYKVGYATSPDGIVWTKDTVHNPIFGPGTAFWEAGGIHGRCVMPVAEGGYKIWYEGYEGPPNYYSKIGYATSEDEINWMRDTLHNPILGPGNPGDWDDSYIFMPDVLYISGSYYMYYGGAKPGLVARQIGLATSPDGINWIKDTVHNPVLPRGNPGEWDADLVQMGRLLLVGDSLYMWYTGDPVAPHLWRIGLATSPFEVVSVHQGTNQPTEFTLAQNYPNPFNPSTAFRYSIPNESKVIIKIYDILGKEIETLVNEEKPAGTYEITWFAANLPSGVYFYELKAGDFIQTKKMILMK